MSRINTNVSSLTAQHRLQQSNSSLETSLRRLSTGLAISRGSDNPAGLIVSERLRSEISGVRQAVDNAERAANVIATTEGALEEISTLLNEMRGLMVEAANTGAFSKEEIEANQLQIDSAVESITRISNVTSFAGLKTLNGSLSFVTSGVDSTNIQDVNIFGANFGTNASIPVAVEVLNSAETAQLFISGNTAGSPGALLSSVTLEVRGNNGVQVLTFISGTSIPAVAFSINSTKDATGVSATLVDPTDQTSGVVLTSTEFGSDQFVSVRKLEDGQSFQTFDAPGGLGAAVSRDTGEDVLALVNGNLALGDGLDISMRSTTLSIEMSLTAAAATTLALHNFDITGGGSFYQLGASINSNNQVGFGIQSVAARNLGNAAMGFLNSITSGGSNSLVNGSARLTEQVVDVAIDQISILRGRLGAFERNTL